MFLFMVEGGIFELGGIWWWWWWKWRISKRLVLSCSHERGDFTFQSVVETNVFNIVACLG